LPSNDTLEGKIRKSKNCLQNIQNGILIDADAENFFFFLKSNEPRIGNFVQNAI
jgi:hypothetical protein